MSDYTQVSFTLPKDKSIAGFKKHAYKLFDAINVIDSGERVGRDNDIIVYEMVISELSLLESLDILKSLNKKFAVTFVVSYGVLYF